MPEEVLHHLRCEPGKTYADCTLGGAGHTRAILEKILPDGFLIAMDQDMDAIRNAKAVLKPHLSGGHVHLFHGNFIHLPEAMAQAGISSVDGILLDLGLSLHQLTSGGRGFSFQRDEPLDMRMNTESDTSAADMINQMSAAKLEKIFREYGEERWARRIAKAIVAKRKGHPIRSSGELAQIVCDVVPRPKSRKARGHSSPLIHPATKVFMALRIAVNKELERLDMFMENILETSGHILKPGGRICVLSFHSLEDRIVKHRFREMAKGCTCPPKFPQCVCGKKGFVRVITRKVQQPTVAEIADNPMSRSTKLRVAEKI